MWAVLRFIVRLTEVYYECRTSKLGSWFGAVGISSGTALSVKVFVLLLLALVLSRKVNGTKKTGIYKTYGVDEREEVYLPGFILFAGCILVDYYYYYYCC